MQSEVKPIPVEQHSTYADMDEMRVRVRAKSILTGEPCGGYPVELPSLEEARDVLAWAGEA